MAEISLDHSSFLVSHEGRSFNQVQSVPFIAGLVVACSEDPLSPPPEAGITGGTKCLPDICAGFWGSKL